MTKTTRVTDIAVYQDILNALDTGRKRLKYDSPESRVLRKYVEALLEAGSPLSYSNYNTALMNCLIEINQCIKNDNNGFVKPSEINLMDDIRRELGKVNQEVNYDEVSYYD